jgi:serine phosphatase RsbU (regulator of sigma subunit)
MTSRPMTGRAMTGRAMTGRAMTGRPITARPVASRPVARHAMARRPVLRRPVTSRPVANRPMASRAIASRAIAGRARTTRGMLALLVLPFALIAAIGLARSGLGPGWGMLLAVGPAVAAAIGGPRYTLTAGAAALGTCLLLRADLTAGRHPAAVSLAAVAGVTAAGALASRARQRRDHELAQVRLVADAAQQVLLRPVPERAGPVRLSARYLSASSGARVGGDLYEVVSTPGRVRLVVGDAEGKGLPALHTAAAVLGVFREAAHEEDSLAAIARRIEASLARQPGEEQFVTAILAEVSADSAKLELLSCGHPPPLLLGAAPPQLADLGPGSLPLGLGHLTGEPRIPVTIPFGPGDQVLFYTDGVAEARNRAGTFFPLADCAAARAPHDPATLVSRLSDEVIRHVGHAPDDDVALLLIYRDEPASPQPGIEEPFGSSVPWAG